MEKLGHEFQSGNLRDNSMEFLQEVPLFKGAPSDEVTRVVEKLYEQSVASGEVIIRQGDPGNSLFIIARGIVRVSCTRGMQEHYLATLMAGNFFGEMALLHSEPRTATCRAATSTLLYELNREDFDDVRKACPTLEVAVEKADRERKEHLRELGLR